MASLYDYGLPQLNQNLMNMYSMVQQEKKNKMLENAQNIENTAAMFKLANDMKQQQMLDKDVLFSGFLEAKGASPNVIQKTNQYLQSLGYMDEVGRIKARNIPAAIQTMNQDPHFQLGILQENWNDAGQKMVALDEEINKLKEKNDPQKQQELAYKIMQREKLKVAQFNYKNMMDKLTGAKTDLNRSKDEILAQGGLEAERLIDAYKRLERDKSDDYIDWGYGQKRNKRTGEIVKVPTAPKESQDSIIDKTFMRQATQDVIKRRSDALTQSNNLKLIHDVMSLVKNGQVTGKGGVLKGWLAPYAEMIGLDTKGLDEAQAFNILARIMVGPMRLDIVGPGPVSEWEQRLLAEVSGKGATKYTAQMVLKEWERKAQQKIQDYNDSLSGITAINPTVGTVYKPIDIPKQIEGNPGQSNTKKIIKLKSGKTIEVE